MVYNSVVISSGHGKYVAGASGVLVEVDEARRVVDAVAEEMFRRGIEVRTFHDDVSQTQNENLNRIVDYHNSQVRDLDVSVHFNAYVETDKPMGCEVLYCTQSSLAGQMSRAIADAGDFIDRGPKKRSDLFFLNNTAAPAILLEVCFVDSTTDADLYRENVDAICDAIAGVIGGDEQEVMPPSEETAAFHAVGKVSTFGGPDDMGVDPDEGLAFHHDINEDNQYLFLPMQPEDTTGLARRLNPYVHYVACRWNYDVTPKAMLATGVALVRVPDTGLAMFAFCADWGPNENTGRVADLSPGLMADLGLTTDDEVEVVFPA